MKKYLNLLKLAVTGLTAIPIIRGSFRNLPPKLFQKERLISYQQNRYLGEIKNKHKPHCFVNKKFFSEKSDFLKNLNENQKKAVTCHDKRICVIAGPGCGKTKTMTSRATYLLKNNLVKPDQILLVTFSKNSAEEMESRIRGYLRKEEELLPNNIGTIHSFCYRFLQENVHLLGIEDIDVCIREHQEDLIQEILKEMDSALYSNNREIKTIVGKISYCKVLGIKGFSLMSDFHRKVAFKYQEYLEKNNLLDFEDLLLNTLKILQENQEIREKYQERFSHILVDEFQDVNEIQWKIIKLLTGEEKSLFVVGDPNQCIYGFQGANPELIASLKKDVDWTNIHLNINYRSTSNIIKATNDFSKRNLTLIKNELIPVKEKGESIRIKYSTVKEIIRELSQLNEEKKINLNEIAIIYRNNYLSNKFEKELIKRNIPYKILGDDDFIEREEIKDIIGYIESVIFQKNSSILTILRKSGSVGESTVEIIEDGSKNKEKEIYYFLNNNFGSNKKNIETFQLEKKQIEKLSSFIDCLNQLKRESLQAGKLSNFTKEIIDSFSYYDYLVDRVNFFERKENIEQFLRILKKWEERNHKFFNRKEAAEKFLQYLKHAFEKKDPKKEESKLVLSTVHQAKGLEFEVVFFVNLDEGIIPSHRASNIDEEARIFYVGMTRAKDRLYLTNSISQSSIFLKDLKKRSDF